MLPIHTASQLVLGTVCSEPDKCFIKQFDATVSEQLSNPGFGVAQLADILAMSRTQLTRKSILLLGSPPGKYILTKRLSLALALLNEGDQPVKNIAHQAGFQNYSSFWRAFTKTFKHSPTDYSPVRLGSGKSVVKWDMPPDLNLKKQLILVLAQRPRIRDLFRLMLHNLRNDQLTLAHFADDLCIGPSQLLRDVRSVLGVTPMKLLLHLRLLLAAELLGSTSLPIGEVAHQAGFFDQAHLSRSFRTVFSKSPSTYRRNNQQEDCLFWLRNQLMQQDVML